MRKHCIKMSSVAAFRVPTILFTRSGTDKFRNNISFLNILNVLRLGVSGGHDVAREPFLINTASRQATIDVFGLVDVSSRYSLQALCCAFP